jgi:hypothetical protein
MRWHIRAESLKPRALHPAEAFSIVPQVPKSAPPIELLLELDPHPSSASRRNTSSSLRPTTQE